MLKYAVIGAGGVGGVVGYRLTEAGKDVTLIARGEHLQAMQSAGLTIRQLWQPKPLYQRVKADSMDHYEEQPDVIIVCVKGYSLDSTYEFIRRVAKPSAIIIPVLNIFGTGEEMQRHLPGLLVMDGCIYVSANIEEPGVLLQHGKICRIVYGVRQQEEYCPVLEQVQQDFADAGIDGILTPEIRRDALSKFCYVSPIGSAGLYYNCTSENFQRPGKERELLVEMMREVIAVGAAMGIALPEDIIETNLRIADGLAPGTTTSMQRDIMAGRDSEVDGLVYQMVRLGEKYQVPTPAYCRVAEKLKRMGDF